MDPKPTVAIVGRPNVGKSTLFNRLIGKRHAIIAKEAGTTRDRLFQRWDCNGYDVLLVDTGGLEYEKKENIESDIQAQATLAIEEADVILFVIDAAQELTVDDFTAATLLRKTNKPVIVIANKCDNAAIETQSYNIYELGFEDHVRISAIHKTGIENVQSDIEKTLKKLKFKKSKKKAKVENRIPICILGKPNAGKSSLVNALLGEDKVIVSEIAGTTRDTTDTDITFEKQDYTLIDTAGLKRPGKIQRGIEKFSALRCLTAIEKSEVVVLLIDGDQGLTSQDAHIAELVLEQKKGLIIAVNKIDLLEKGEELRDRMLAHLRRRLSFIPWAPVVFISAKNKKNTREILKLTKEIVEERKKRIKTAELNVFLQKTIMKHLPASAKNKKPKFFYGSQVEVNPPKFVLFFKYPENLHFSYPRYIENSLRKEYGFNGTAIEIRFKARASQA
jgi:GTPase